MHIAKSVEPAELDAVVAGSSPNRPFVNTAPHSAPYTFMNPLNFGGVSANCYGLETCWCGSALRVQVPPPGTTMLQHMRAGKLSVNVAVLSGSGDDALMAEARGLYPDAMFKKPPD